MSPPPVAPEKTDSGSVGNSTPLAPGPTCFPFMPVPQTAASNGVPANSDPVKALQAAQLQATQQLFLQQQLAAKPMNGPAQANSATAMPSVANAVQANPMQFFMATTAQVSQQGQAPQAPAPFVPVVNPNWAAFSMPFLAQQQQQALDPNTQMQACANVIQEALRNPQFAAAGQVLLQSMQSGSTFMNELMKNQPQGVVPPMAQSSAPVAPQPAASIPSQPMPTAPQPMPTMSQPRPAVSQPMPMPTMSQPTPTTSQPMPTPTMSQPTPPTSQPTSVVSESTNVVPPQPTNVTSHDTIKTNVNQEKLFLESSLEPVKREEKDDLDDDLWKDIMKGLDSDPPMDVQSTTSSKYAPELQLQPEEENTPVLQSCSPVLAAAPSPSSAPLPPVLSLTPPTTKSKQESPKTVPVRAECGKVKKTKPPITFTFEGSPQKYLMAILKERGYSTERILCSESNYQFKASPLELASFGTEVVKCCNTGNVETLSSLLDAGLSPTPCNSFGDFIIHLVCKRADIDILQCLVDRGTNLQVCDSFGRTPLHHVAWAGKFCPKSAELIMDTHIDQILIQDNRGQTPLEYVRQADWPKWVDFLKLKMDTYWPIDKESRLSPAPQVKKTPDPPVISLELARAVSSGAMSPDAVMTMDDHTRREWKQESLRSLLL